MRLDQFALIGFCIIAAGCGDKPAVDRRSLPPFNASNIVTVSGISSGGYMAGQYQVAFSNEVSGVAIVAAGPWGCAQGSISRALAECISGESIDIASLQTKASELASAGKIDPLDYLASDRLFLFLGRNDAVIKSAAIEAAKRWNETFLEPANIRVVTDVPAAHGWVTADYGAGCDEFAAPYINDCGYDLARALLSHAYGDLNPPAETVSDVRRFDQQEFGDAGLDTEGYAYVPSDCTQGSSCRVHIFFHGCEQSAATIGAELVKHSGLSRWAESNSIIVLYPQVKPSRVAPLNPLGCWDWWGYTTKDYLTKRAPQLAAVHGMAQRLASPKD